MRALQWVEQSRTGSARAARKAGRRRKAKDAHDECARRKTADAVLAEVVCLGSDTDALDLRPTVPHDGAADGDPHPDERLTSIADHTTRDRGALLERQLYIVDYSTGGCHKADVSIPHGTRAEFRFDPAGFPRGGDVASRCDAGEFETPFAVGVDGILRRACFRRERDARLAYADVGAGNEDPPANDGGLGRGPGPIAHRFLRARECRRDENEKGGRRFHALTRPRLDAWTD